MTRRKKKKKKSRKQNLALHEGDFDTILEEANQSNLFLFHYQFRKHAYSNI